MARRLIGTATTNANGVATLDYTGKGVGELNLIAWTSIDGTSYVTPNYLLIDAKYLSNGDCYGSSSLSKSTDNYGTTISATTTAGVWSFSTGSTTASIISLTAPFTIEFDMLSYSGGWTIRIDGDTTQNVFQSTSENAGIGHYKIIMNGTTITVYKDGVSVNSISNITADAKTFRIRIEPNSSMKINKVLYY